MHAAIDFSMLYQIDEKDLCRLIFIMKRHIKDGRNIQLSFSQVLFYLGSVAMDVIHVFHGQSELSCLCTTSEHKHSLLEHEIQAHLFCCHGFSKKYSVFILTCAQIYFL